MYLSINKVSPMIIAVLCVATAAQSTTEPPPSTTQRDRTPINEDSVLIGFDTPTVTVSEGAGVAVLCYNIVGGSAVTNVSSVKLSVSVVDITATGNADYTPISSSLFVTLGRDVSTDCFHVHILEDSIPEGSENFTVTLSSSDRSLVMITQDTVQVVIVDTCIDGEVRLRGGFDEFQGRVEICFNRVWGTVCDDGWDDSDARVVCRQLGYPNSEVTRGFQGAVYGEGVGPILLDQVRCNGDEPELVDCTHDGFNVHNCIHIEDSSVDCLGRRVGVPCSTNGDVRLVNGQDETQGRVEFCYDGVWGTICDDNWDNNDATVVCRQLGFNEPTSAVALKSAAFGQGHGEIVLDDLFCFGHESTLTECPRRDFFVHNCGHSEDAGVDCDGAPAADDSCSMDGDVRLVNGQDETQGRVEFCYGGVWGTVCDDLWDKNDATVVCRQLGFSEIGAVALGQAAFGPGVGEIVLDDVQCIGTENTLTDCTRRNFFAHNCDHSEDASVDCVAESTTGSAPPPELENNVLAIITGAATGGTVLIVSLLLITVLLTVIICLVKKMKKRQRLHTSQTVSTQNGNRHAVHEATGIEMEGMVHNQGYVKTARKSNTLLPTTENEAYGQCIPVNHNEDDETSEVDTHTTSAEYVYDYIDVNEVVEQ